MIPPLEWPKAKTRAGSMSWSASTSSISASRNATSSTPSRAATPQHTPAVPDAAPAPPTFTPSGCTTTKPLASASPSMRSVAANWSPHPVPPWRATNSGTGPAGNDEGTYSR